MTTVEEERALTINSLMKFKEAFPRGFKQVFSGNNIANLKEHFKADIDGLVKPIKNEINSLVADLLSDTGLVKLVSDITAFVSGIVTDITENEGVQDGLKTLSTIINGIAISLSTLLGWVSDLWGALADLFGDLPPPPGFGINTTLIPGPVDYIIMPPIPDPDDTILRDRSGDDSNDFGFH